MEGGLLVVVAVLLVQAVVAGLEVVLREVVAATLAEVEREEPAEGAWQTARRGALWTQTAPAPAVWGEH